MNFVSEQIPVKEYCLTEIWYFELFKRLLKK